MGHRPRTGEPRQKQRTLKLDVLIAAQPQVRDAILSLRDQGATWPEIAEQSARPWSKEWAKDHGGFVNWDELPTPSLEAFPDLRLPQTSLQRWFDLRVRQVRAEVLKESERARTWAQEFAAKSIPDANSAVINALRDQVFEMMRSVGRNDQATFVKGLQNLTLAMSRMQRVELQAKRVEADLAKIDAERAKLAAEAGDPREIYLLASQDLLKKLRSREQVRAVIDAIKEELIQEFTHGAEAFAKQIEASTA
jgi:hypothetical protein